jgi:hypothetical protein
MIEIPITNNSTPRESNNKTSEWEDIIAKYVSKEDLQSTTCKIFNKRWNHSRTNDKCPCGRLIRCHSYNGECLTGDFVKADANFEAPKQFKNRKHVDYFAVDTYGRSGLNKYKFVRLRIQTKLETVFQILSEDCDRKPRVIMSIYGGAKHFTMAESLEKEFIRGIIEAANSAGIRIELHLSNDQ